MGRMTKEKFQHAKRLFEGETGRALIAHCETIELELKISKEDEQRALDAMNRLMDNVSQLSNENKRLMNEVDETRAAWLELEKKVPEKVALPEEKADAIKWSLMADKNNAGVIHRYTSDNYIGPKTGVLRSIPLDTLLSALVNGYTVEKTKEERLREGVSDIIETHYPFMANNDVASKVIDFVTKFNAEN